MQTFLPYKDFAASAKALDNKRLGKQRVETLQILRALTGQSKGWVNHPATRMWRGHEVALCSYGVKICAEWIGRGFKDTCSEKILDIYDALPVAASRDMPSWLGTEVLHLSHRSNLVRKDPAHYGAMWPYVPPTIPYVWPVT